MLQPIPYVLFDGNCEEAMRFYEKTLAAKLEATVRFSDMPGCGELPAEQAGRLAHARLAFQGKGMLYAGDSHPMFGYEGVKGVMLTLNYDSVGQAQEAFAALSEGGKVSMPMAPALWAEVAGMLTDRFGVEWIINGVLKPVGEAHP
ncbi:MAG: VOC family protein [Telluria sp.]